MTEKEKRAKEARSLKMEIGAVILWIATLAEVNRAPFDMPEAEQELTAGYHSEYSGMKFALFFMAEYQKMIVVSAILAVLYFGVILVRSWTSSRGSDRST